MSFDCLLGRNAEARHNVATVLRETANHFGDLCYELGRRHENQTKRISGRRRRRFRRCTTITIILFVTKKKKKKRENRVTIQVFLKKRESCC